MYKQYISYFFFVLFVSVSFAQRLEGTVKDNFGVPLPRANVIIKTSRNNSRISEFFIANDQGKFSYLLKKKYDTTIFLEVNVLNFEKTIDSINSPNEGNTYNIDFVIFPKITQLEEVIIAERKKFSVKKDTVIFNPEAYKDGTERKVEDLLKKLPGIEVAENGKIKYRGKIVEVVQLDGDDLFGHNYSIGTKNISINMVDQIEAIENYSKNPLLKGIENSDNVALNLKLKKGKIDYSGTSDFGYGYGDKPYYDIATNILGIAKSFKSFGIFSFNNIGVNHSPFDYFSNSTTLEDIENVDLYAENIINDTPLSSVLSNSRTRLNNEWFGSYNFIYKISPTFSIKSNVYYLKDEFFRQELYENDFLIGSERINYSDRTEIIKKPENKRLDIKLTYNVSKKSLLEIESSISKEAVSSSNDFTRNLESNFDTKLKTDDFFWRNKIEFTNKLNQKTALQFKSLYSRNNTPQEFNTIGNFFSNEDVVNSYVQFSEYRKEVFQNHLILLGKRKNIKYAFTGGVDYFINPFRSSVVENEIRVSDFRNEFDYKKTNYFSQFSLFYIKKKWTIEPSLGVNYISQRLENNMSDIEVLKKNVFFPIPALKVVHRFNSVSTLRFSGSYEQKTPEESFLFRNEIITNNRSVRRNVVSLDLEKLQKYSLGYRMNDLFKNIDLNLLGGYTNRRNTYLSNINVNPNFTGITYFQSPINLEDYFVVFSIERYIRFIRTTFKHSSQYSVANFKNVVNQSELRNGKSQNYNGSIFAKTAFGIPLNFENKITYTVNTYEIVGQSNNTNYSIKNALKAIVKPNKKWLFTITYDYFKPDTTRNEDFSFLDFEIKYKPEKIKWISGRFVGKNLLDNRVFQQIQNSDFSTTVYQSNLIPRYFMLSLDVSF
ncbi:TonB-dependent receptor [Aquimarina sp. AU474]|uniref:TonB-dependent receptor n=1 Tax=Aquimarina sp. AU474 TaxID=2108529 RepID=UPI000D69B266|nr:TonB-dependent receptor [Aquimarina sp. AU474]